MAKDKTIQRILDLVDELTRQKQEASHQYNRSKAACVKADKYERACELVWMQGDLGSRAILTEQLGNAWGVNVEMKTIYSPKLKEQLRVSIPIHNGT